MCSILLYKMFTMLNLLFYFVEHEPLLCHLYHKIHLQQYHLIVEKLPFYAVETPSRCSS